MNIFDILGPVMIGPSSSHTAGAVRAGNVAAQLLAKPIKRAEITLYGSFAKTYYGHGTDCAIVGGLLGFSPSDHRIPESHRLAVKAGMDFTITADTITMSHPNTVKLVLVANDESSISVTVESLGGGAINIVRIDDAEVSFTTEYYTTVVFNDDRSGVLSDITAVYASHGINIAFMRLFRVASSAIMVIESDIPISDEISCSLKAIKYVNKIITISPLVI